MSNVDFRKIAKSMILIASFKKFLSYQFIASVEISNMARWSSKSDELRNINSIGCRARYITIYHLKWEIDNFESKSSHLS